MKLEIVSKNGYFVPKNAEEYLIKKLNKLNKFISDDFKATALFQEYPSYFKVEVTIPIKNLILRAETKNKDLLTCLDELSDKLVSQIKKYQKRVNKKIDKEGIKDTYKDDLDLELLEKEVLAKQIVKNKYIKLKPMTKEEAINQMELLGHDFYVFIDKETNNVAICYLREDKNYSIMNIEE